MNDPLDLELLELVGGSLDPERRRAVEERVAADPERSARLRDYRYQDAALHALFDPVLSEPVPWRLRARAPHAPRRAVFAAAGWLLLGAIGGGLATHLLLAPGEAPSVVEGLALQAAVAHVAFAPDARRPVEIAADQEQALVAWLSRRMGRSMRAPALGQRGLSLVGGRLLPGDLVAPAAQLMYATARGERVTLFVRGLPHAEAPTAFSIREEGGVTILYWADRDWGYALSGALPRSALLELAALVHAQLDDVDR